MADEPPFADKVTKSRANNKKKSSFFVKRTEKGLHQQKTGRHRQKDGALDRKRGNLYFKIPKMKYYITTDD